ncbi:hypothetical protein LTR08_001781 [Meristemomyces frigidus]|nr:hypothetical protein LTR08_001781 [Meristemomyces frigidus]
MAGLPQYPAPVQAHRTGFSSVYEHNVNNQLRDFPDPAAYPTAAPQPFDRIEEPPRAASRNKRFTRRWLLVTACVTVILTMIALFVGLMVSYEHGRDSKQSATTPMPEGSSQARSTSTATVTITSTTFPDNLSTRVLTSGPMTSLAPRTVSDMAIVTTSIVLSASENTAIVAEPPQTLAPVVKQAEHPVAVPTPIIEVPSTAPETETVRSPPSRLHYRLPWSEVAASRIAEGFIQSVLPSLSTFLIATATIDEATGVQTHWSVSTDMPANPELASLTLLEPEPLITPVTGAAPTTEKTTCSNGKGCIGSHHTRA